LTRSEASVSGKALLVMLWRSRLIPSVFRCSHVTHPEPNASRRADMAIDHEKNCREMLMNQMKSNLKAKLREDVDLTER